MKTNGQEYKLGAGVVLDVNNDVPLVGLIQDIYVVNGSKVAFHVEQFSTSYEPHFRAYILNESVDAHKFFYLSMLFLITPVHVRTSQALAFYKYIIIPHALCTL